jgi:predicted TIM-barrel fold metal-dependent hydrolase
MYHHSMMQTPWGPVAISDAHVHFFSQRFYSELASQKRLTAVEDLQPILNWELPPANPVWLSDRWVKELDSHQVDRACLIASIPGDETSVSEAVAAHPGRFFGYFMANPLAPDAVDRIRNASRNPQLHCVCLFPAMHRYSIADSPVQTILEIAAESRLAVFVHCGALSVGVRGKLGLPSLFDMRYSNPLDLHPVALRFPQIRFVIPHFGAGLFREALMLADLCPNVWLDTSSSNRWMAYENLQLSEVFRRSLSLIGPGRLLFGTDSSFFPRGWQAGVFQEQIRAMTGAGVGEAAARQILGGNLLDLHKPRTTYFSPGTQA